MKPVVRSTVRCLAAMAGLFADVKSGALRAGDTVVFVHTGGLPSVLHEGGLWDA